uniref:Uncharacterized protein n=1 Tax=Panagrolaimus sp. PS1159 TaxID=55785 RepID=A0AC35GG60_9BILA
MLSRSRNNLATLPNLTLPTDSFIEATTAMAEGSRKSSFSLKSHDSERSEKGRKCSADTISRKSSFGTKKLVSFT